jgi:hypothetical protein
VSRFHWHLHFELSNYVECLQHKKTATDVSIQYYLKIMVTIIVMVVHVILFKYSEIMTLVLL